MIMTPVEIASISLGYCMSPFGWGPAKITAYEICKLKEIRVHQ